MSLYVIAGLVAVVLGFVVWLWVTARKAGGTAVVAAVATETVDSQKRQEQAAVQAPRTEEQAAQAMDKGTF